MKSPGNVFGANAFIQNMVSMFVDAVAVFVGQVMCVCVWCGKKPLEIKLNLSENGFKRFSHTDFRLPFFEHLQILTRVPQKRNVQLL